MTIRPVGPPARRPPDRAGRDPLRAAPPNEESEPGVDVDLTTELDELWPAEDFDAVEWMLGVPLSTDRGRTGPGLG